MSGNNNFLATATTTNNTDRRSVLSDAVMVGDGASASLNTTTNTTTVDNSVTYSADAEVLKYLAQAVPDAAVALGQQSATTLRDMGGSIVNLNRDSLTANTKAFDSVIDFGSSAIDKQIEMMAASMGIAANNVKAGTDLASKAIDAFTPTENKNADIGKYAMIAAACVAVAVLLWKQS
jgi:hypothetical protein